jgi:hypothetical protein
MIYGNTAAFEACISNKTVFDTLYCFDTLDSTLTQPSSRSPESALSTR